ncbi:MAG: DinB family protein [Bacteroidota bacterium]
MTLSDIQTLYDYDQWATARILETAATLTEEQFKKDLSSSHGGVQGTLVHTYSADRIWLERWMEHPALPTGIEEVPTYQILKEKWQQYQKDIREFIRTLTEQKLQAKLGYQDVRGNPHAEPLVRQMQHKVNHSSYHRGQVVAMFRQLGVKPQSTDLINYYRLLEQKS